MRSHLNFSAALALLCLSTLAMLRADAATLYSSPMTAPPLTAGNLVGQDGWTAHSGAGVVPIQVTAAGTLVDSNGGGTREDANVAFTPIAAGQTYYFGFDVAVNGGTTQVYFAHFKDISTDFTTRTFVSPSLVGGDFVFGMSPAGSSPNVTWPSGQTFGQTYRLVGSYNADTLECKLWVDPTSEASPSISAIDSAANAVSAFGLRQATADNTQLITNLAIGTSFSDVVNPVPEPSTFGLAAAALGIASFSARRRHRRAA